MKMNEVSKGEKKASRNALERLVYCRGLAHRQLTLKIGKFHSSMAKLENQFTRNHLDQSLCV